jgi:hypothetical protein
MFLAIIITTPSFAVHKNTTNFVLPSYLFIIQSEKESQTIEDIKYFVSNSSSSTPSVNSAKNWDDAIQRAALSSKLPNTVQKWKSFTGGMKKESFIAENTLIISTLEDGYQIISQSPGEYTISYTDSNLNILSKEMHFSSDLWIKRTKADRIYIQKENDRFIKTAYFEGNLKERSSTKIFKLN